MHAGPDRRDARGQEGAGRLPGRVSRERAELEGTAGRPEGARPGAGAGTRRSATARSASGRRSTRRFPPTRHQRCWVHKTVNVLEKLPKSLQPAAHADLREIWLSPSRAAAEAAMATLRRRNTPPKYDDAVKCLLKDRDALLTFFDFPAEHWAHLRTTNPIESVFATVRHRTERMKGALSQDTAKIMVFKLIMAASKSWRRLKGQNQLPKLISRRKVRGRNRDRRRNQDPPLDPLPSPTFPHSSRRHAPRRRRRRNSRPC